jgi:DNA (cytosine-5)-methyltransferase 1
VDLFSGIGGTRLAFQNIGGTCVFSSEIDRFARQTYFENFNEFPRGNIRRVKEKEVPDHDILVAGFPCQAFSISGISKRRSLKKPHGFNDKVKGTLFFDIARILDQKKPSAFLLENVKNLKSHNKHKTFETIIETLVSDLGYHVFEKIIDARLVVPQHRERIFLVGFREPVAFDFPTFEDNHPKLKNILEPVVDPKYTLNDHLWEYLQAYARKHKKKGNGFGYGLSNLESYTRTLSARYYKDGSEILVPQDSKNPRRLTPRECARLMGFPDSFKIPVSDTQAYKQFGNSVVVPVVQKIAEAMVTCLFPTEPTL